MKYVFITSTTNLEILLYLMYKRNMVSKNFDLKKTKNNQISGVYLEKREDNEIIINLQTGKEGLWVGDSVRYKTNAKEARSQE